MCTAWDHSFPLTINHFPFPHPSPLDSFLLGIQDDEGEKLSFRYRTRGRPSTSTNARTLKEREGVRNHPISMLPSLGWASVRPSPRRARPMPCHRHDSCMYIDWHAGPCTVHCILLGNLHRGPARHAVRFICSFMSTYQAQHTIQCSAVSM